MKKIMVFAKNLVLKIFRDDLFVIANNMTYHLLLSIFPFVIFLISLASLFQIKTELLAGLFDAFPEALRGFFNEAAAQRRPELLSAGLVLALWSSSRGMRAASRGINKIYSLSEKKGFIREVLAGIALVLCVALAIPAALVILTFGGAIRGFLEGLGAARFLPGLIFGLVGNIAALALICAIVLMIYRLGISGRVNYRKLLPGALFTTLAWLSASKLFNFFVTNFMNISRFYGSIAGIIALLYWLNILSVSLLIGAEINALLDKPREA